MAINNNQRYMRKTIVLAKVETTYGTDALPAANDALLISEATLTYQSNNKTRDVIRPYLGAAEELVGDDSMQLSFTCEAAGSGTKGTAPAWGKLLQGCGFAEVVTAGSRVTYNPVSEAFSSLTMVFCVDGVWYKLTGCRGTVTLDAAIGDTPKFKFTFTGRYDGLIGTTAVTASLGAWKVPLMVTNYNTGSFVLGGAYANGAVTGGEEWASRGFSLNIGNSVVYQPMLGANADRVLITDRQASGSVTLDLTAAAEATFRADVRANTPRALSFSHGTVDGSRLLIWAPRAQFTNPQIVNQDGVAMSSFDTRLMPSAGNDELLIVSA